MEDEEEGVKYEGGGRSAFFSIAETWHDSDGDFHRLAGPAVIFQDGELRWYRHGRLHRDDGPARVWPAEGIEDWYKDGDLYEPTAHEIMAWKMTQKKKD
jgi:hypothetical protein